MQELPEPICHTPQSGSGRADLLYALKLTEQDPVRENSLAAILGFFPKPEQEKPRQKPDDQSQPQKQQSIERNPQSKLKNVFRPYRLCGIEKAENQSSPQPTARQTAVLSVEDSGVWDIGILQPKSAPILPWPRLWPKLRQAVASRHPAGVDIRTLTDKLAKAETVRRLPLKTRLAWPDPMPVILDFSDRLTVYWDDWHWLRRQLAARLHNRVSFHRLAGPPPQPLQLLKEGQPPGRPRPWPLLSHGSTLLVFSDLGMTDPGRPWPSECWRRRLQDYRRQGVRAIVMAPVSAIYLQAELTRLAAIVRLSPDSNLRPCPRLPPQTGSGSHPGLPALLSMMAVATRVEPGLLRELRRCLPEHGQDAGLEAAAWLHPELNTAATACGFTPWAAPLWQGRFRDLPSELQQRSLDCLRRWHAGLAKAIHHEETLLWHGLANPGIAASQDRFAEQARGFFGRIKESLKQIDNLPYADTVRELLVQLADRHVEWIAPMLGNTESYLAELSAAVAVLEPQRFREGLPKGLDPRDWLGGIPPQTPRDCILLQEFDQSLTLMEISTFNGPKTGQSPLAYLTLDRLALLWEYGNQHGKTQNYRTWFWLNGPDIKAQPCLPGILAAEEAAVDLLLDFYIHDCEGRHCFKSRSAPAWASAYGQDKFGLYADLTVNTVTQRFRWINPGTFLMGSPVTEAGRYDDETLHQVTLSQGYWLADTACSQTFWLAVMGANPSAFNEDGNNPVEQVSWNDVQNFILKLNAQFPDLAARLPTEAEWEYACRAGTVTPFSFGENITPEQVNYDGNRPYNNGPKGLYRHKTVPVKPKDKEFSANPWGLYHMHGNVWEWCQDWFVDYEKGAAIDPTGPETGSERVLRGGAWHNLARSARSAQRLRFEPDDRNQDIGFRLALGRGASR